jgi:3-oxoadipate enol-lactonase
MPFENIEGSPIYAADYGDGEPILLIHGISNFNRAWSSQIGGLVASGYRVIVPDLPGHGASAPLTRETKVDDLAQAMVALLDHKQIASANVCGVSLGGMVGLTMALRSSARVRRLIVADTASRFDTDFHKTMVAGWKSAFLEPEGPIGRLSKTWPLLANENFRKSQAGQEVFEEWLVNALRASGSSYACVCDGILKYNIENELPKISVPTLVLVGSEDQMLSPAVNKTIADKIPGAAYEIIDGGSHLPNVDSASLFNASLMRFLTKG